MNEMQTSISGLGLAGLFLVWFVVTALGAYIGTRFTNIATKQDVAEITRKVEQVRSDYAHLLEEAKARHQLRLAAIDKRLQAHQEAFAHWIAMFKRMHQPDLLTKVNECRDWWENNCLYLEPSVRDAFIQAFNAAMFHKTILDGRRDANNADEREEYKKDIKENWATIERFSKVVFEAVQLPTMSEPNAKEMAPNVTPEGETKKA